MKDWAVQRYPWGVTRSEIDDAFLRISKIKDNTEVNCLKGKYWEFIVEDLLEEVQHQ